MRRQPAPFPSRAHEAYTFIATAHQHHVLRCVSPCAASLQRYQAARMHHTLSSSPRIRPMDFLASAFAPLASCDTKPFEPSMHRRRLPAAQKSHVRPCVSPCSDSQRNHQAASTLRLPPVARQIHAHAEYTVFACRPCTIPWSALCQPFHCPPATPPNRAHAAYTVVACRPRINPITYLALALALSVSGAFKPPL